MLIDMPKNYKPTKGRVKDPIRYLTGKKGGLFPQWQHFSAKSQLLDHPETFLDRTTRERIFVSHPYVTEPRVIDEMRMVLDACGINVVWFRDSWYNDVTWCIELRNATIRGLITNGESRKVLKQGCKSVLVG